MSPGEPVLRHTFLAILLDTAHHEPFLKRSSQFVEVQFEETLVVWLEERDGKRIGPAFLACYNDHIQD